jgi:hypothetical protein
MLVKFYLNKQARCGGMHACNPSYVGVVGRRITVCGQFWVKKLKTISKKNNLTAERAGGRLQTLAEQMQGPDFQAQYYQKPKK